MSVELMGLNYQARYDVWVNAVVVMELKAWWWFPVRLFVGMPRIWFKIGALEFPKHRVTGLRVNHRVTTGEHRISVMTDWTGWWNPWKVKDISCASYPVELS